jgi:hypothetical protein
MTPLATAPASSTQSASEIIRAILAGDPDFRGRGVLTAEIGYRFAPAHPEKKTFKEIVPDGTITEFIRTNLADFATIAVDPENHVRIFVRAKDAEAHVTTLRAEQSTLPPKLYRLRGFLMALDPGERQALTFTGEFLHTLLGPYRAREQEK